MEPSQATDLDSLQQRTSASWPCLLNAVESVL